MNRAALLAFSLLLLGACGTHREVADSAVVVALPPPVPSSSAVEASGATVPSAQPDASRRPLVEVLYATRWSGYERLLGVDPTAHRAFVWMQSTYGQPIAAEVDTVDYRSGEVVDRWVATPANAADWVEHSGRFHPMTGALDTDLARFASLLEHTDGGLEAGSQLALVPGGRLMLYTIEPARQRGGDGFMVADRRGRPLFELAPSLYASYQVAFSPDGHRAAFRACEPLPGDSCGYHLYLRSLDGLVQIPQVRVDSVPQLGTPFFTSDGETVFASAYHHPNQVCLHRVPFRKPSAAVKVYCARGDDTPYLVPDPAGETAVLAAPVKDPGSMFEYTVVRLSDGAVQGTYPMPGASLAPIVGSHHRLFTEVMPRNVAALDLATGQRRVWTDAELGGNVGHLKRVVEGGAEALFALRNHGAEGRFELVRLNLALE
jgi:hypothetical protein